MFTSSRTRQTFRRTGRLLLWCSLLAALFSAPASAQAAVVLTIRYVQPQAGEVFLAWGVDGWQAAPEAARPSGTVVRDGVMHTPMAAAEDAFEVQLHLRPDTVVDYGFLVAQLADGTAVRFWEADGSADFHLTADEHRTVTHTSALILDGSERAAVGGDGQLVERQIQYTMPEAGEVFLIWGVNGWRTLPEQMRPPETTVSNSVMKTAMRYKDGRFVATVTAPQNGTVDYGFLITRKRSGEPVDVWEAAEDGDFHAAAAGDGPLVHHSRQSLARLTQPNQPLEPEPAVITALALTTLIAAAVAVAAARLYPLPPAADWRRARAWMVAAAVVLVLFLLVARGDLLAFGWISWPVSWVLLPLALVAGYYDILFVVGLTAVFLLMGWLVRNRRRWLRLTTAVYTALAFVTLLVGVANKEIVYLLGRPVTYQLVYYADFLQSSDGQTAVTENLSLDMLLFLAAVVAAWYALAALAARGLAWLAQRPLPRWQLTLPVLALFIYTPLALAVLARQQWPAQRLINPVVAFADSVITAGSQPVLLSMDAPAAYKEALRPPGQPGTLPFGSEPAVRNVVLVVLESVGAQYVEPYDSLYAATPVLSGLQSQAMLFENVYAHAPTSNKSLVSILGGIYPWISYQSLTQEYPQAPLPTISSALQEHGYRTAFLGAGDWRFQRGDEFLAERGFDVVQDFNSLPCDGPRFVGSTEAEPYFDGVNDGCLVDTLAQWVADEPERPFFAVLWTVETHYPYFLAGEERDFGVDEPLLNRYLNALHHGDAQIGRIVDMLGAYGLTDSTLLVVTGDHGEAFGQHNQFGHAMEIYDENVHVPLMLINPRLFDGERSTAVAGHVDISPTIMHLLQLPAPSTWQGRSLFAGDRSNLTYFYAPWGDSLFGLRQDNLKLIYNASTGESELYDLTVDRWELTNLATNEPEQVFAGQQRLAAWVQEHGAFMDVLLATAR